MPQIAQIAATYASQIFWLLIVFGAIYFVIGRGMLPKITATVEAREQRIADDLAAAERARAKADETEATYRAHMDAARAQSQKLTAEAKAAAATETERRVKASDAILSERAAEADARLRTAQAQALSGIEDVAAEAAQDIVRRLAGMSVDRAEAQNAVKSALVNA
jgi:F-type H+-transporting ATPase subunit b